MLPYLDREHVAKNLECGRLYEDVVDAVIVHGVQILAQLIKDVAVD